MSETDYRNNNHRGFAWLVGALDAHGGVLDQSTTRRLLSEATLGLADVAPYIEYRAESYARRCVVRRENYEVLVLTWRPSQGSAAHDHSGSLCGLKVVQGTLIEQFFASSCDGNVYKTTASRLGPGGIAVDPGVVVHSLANATAVEDLVTVHVYSPPLPEVRRYAVTENAPPKLFLRSAPENARTVAIVGGGFTGLMAMANMLRLGNDDTPPLHIVLIDKQTSIGEGVAYRTPDPRHLLNVPAGRMSAWPDLPEDFLTYARSKDPTVNPSDFLPRKFYGEYVRDSMFRHAESASEHLSAELVRDSVTSMEKSPSGGWNLGTAGGKSLHADVAILTVGHRPPNDPLGKQWTGPRTRFVCDPWAALVLSQIGPDESVLLIGTGLTAVDVALTLNLPDRIAPLLAISRRGLIPTAHLRSPKAAANLSDVVEEWLDPSKVLTARELVHSLRERIDAASQEGVEWQQVIDGLRHASPEIWARLCVAERARFLRHVRPFWEIHRHRLAPKIADTLADLRKKNLFKMAAASLTDAKADADGIDVTFCCRGTSCARTERVSWVVNCTGPGVHNLHHTHPFLRPLLSAGTLCNDELSLGLMTDGSGRALSASGEIHADLLVAGTLRKSTLWESTAVPELRQQAHDVACTALAHLREV